MKKITLLLLTGLALVTISAFTVFNSPLLDPSGKTFQTGSPYDKSDCSMCHSGGATTPSVTITSVPAFDGGNTYVAGTTYTVNVICSGSYPKYGFDLEILNSNTTTAADAGTFGAVVTSNCKKVPTSGKPTNITHTAPTGTSNAAVFSFTWTAPATGTAYLYCCINGVNGTGTSSGDKPKTTSLVLTQNTSGVTLLEQNVFNVNVFPNPANDHTTLSYSLAENADVKIELYDISGKKELDVLNEKQNSGEYRELINLAGLKSGIYLAVIKTDGRASTQKLIVY